MKNNFQHLGNPNTSTSHRHNRFFSILSCKGDNEHFTKKELYLISLLLLIIGFPLLFVSFALCTNNTSLTFIFGCILLGIALAILLISFISLTIVLKHLKYNNNKLL